LVHGERYRTGTTMSSRAGGVAVVQHGFPVSFKKSTTMMNKTALIAVLIAAAGLAACGKKEEAPAAAPASAPAATESAQQPAAQQPAADQAQQPAADQAQQPAGDQAQQPAQQPAGEQKQ